MYGTFVPGVFGPGLVCVVGSKLGTSSDASGAYGNATSDGGADDGFELRLTMSGLTRTFCPCGTALAACDREGLHEGRLDRCQPDGGVRSGKAPGPWARPSPTGGSS